MASAITSISDVFVPEKSIPAVAEKSAQGNRLITSGAVQRSPQFDDAVKSGAATAKFPGWAPLRRRSSIQVEDTAPETGKATQGMQVVPVLERVIATAVTALARRRAAASGDPLAFLAGSVADNRTYDQQLTLASLLRGVFGAASFAPLVHNKAVEVSGDVTSANLIDSDMIDDACAKLGELKGELEGGYIGMPTVIETALTKQDRIDVVKNSEGKIVMKTYRGMQVFISDALQRAGTTSGTVYETYIIAPGRLAIGQAAQSNEIGDASSLVIDGDAAKNNLTIYDRFVYALGVYGAKWKGTPAGASATDAELATGTNWELGITDAQAVGVVQLLTNG